MKILSSVISTKSRRRVGRVGFDKDIEVVDVFGKTLPQKRYVKYYLKPNVNIRVEKTEKSYKVWMNISANSTPYNGPVYLSIGDHNLLH